MHARPRRLRVQKGPWILCIGTCNIQTPCCLCNSGSAPITRKATFAAQNLSSRQAVTRT
jgi:hypothetical protein